MAAALARVETCGRESLDGAIKMAKSMFQGAEWAAFQAGIAARRTMLAALDLIANGDIDAGRDLARSLSEAKHRQTIKEAAVAAEAPQRQPA